MIIDTRAYVITVVAVFLALAVGIAIGHSLVRDGGIDMDPGGLVTRLEQDFARMREESRQLREDIRRLQANLAASEAFETAARAALARDRLLGRRVAVVAVGGSSVPQEVLAVLREAGAQVMGVTNVALPVAVSGAGGEQEAELAGALLAPDEERLLLLADQGVVELDGDAFSPVQAAVVLTGPGVRTSGIARLVDELLHAGVQVVGVQRTEDSGGLEIFRARRTSTVDHVDLVAGQISLVYSLSGQPGQYGLKAGAQRKFPDVR